jgi:hypothetical protein
LLIELDSESVSDVRTLELAMSLLVELADERLDEAVVACCDDEEVVDDDLRWLEVVGFVESMEVMDLRAKNADAIVLDVGEICSLGR